MRPGRGAKGRAKKRPERRDRRHPDRCGALGERHPPGRDACSSIRTAGMEGENYGLSSPPLSHALFGI